MALASGSGAEDFAPGGKAWCREHYWHLREEEKNQPSIEATFGTIIGIILYTTLEYVVHYGPEYIAAKKTAQISTVADLDRLPLRETGQVNTGNDELVIKQLGWTWQPKSTPGALTRATRFTQAIFLYVAILVIFILRIRGARDVPYVPEACVEEIGLEGRNWVAIGIFNCVPFALASLAFLRAMIDCILIRWGTHLGNGVGKNGAMLWPPFPPLYLLIIGVGTVIHVLFEGVRVSLCMAMVPKDVRGNRNGNASEQTTDEEEMGLVAHVDGGENSKVDEPPAYKEAVEGKGAQ